MNLKQIRTHFFFFLAKFPMKGQIRRKLVQWGGVRFADNHGFVGENCIFDTMYPEHIHIGRGVHITAGVTILTHYLNTDIDGISWRKGDVYIGDHSFIGTGTIITKDVRIGDNCIVGAGSVITKDIPDNEIWAGNPAHFIKKKPMINMVE